MNLIELRKQLKKRKPTFIRQAYGEKPRLKAVWRKPKGRDSKVALRLRGHVKRVSKGYGSPCEVRGLHPSGLQCRVISTIHELEGIQKDSEGIVVGSAVGKRKMLEIWKKARKEGFMVLNVKDIDARIARIEEEWKKKKDLKKKAQKAEEHGKKGIEEKKEKQEALAEKILSEEERALLNKKEMDKILTKKEI